MTKFELKLGKKKLSFHIGLGFLGEYQYKEGIDINEVVNRIQTNPFKFIPNIMYESVLYRAKRDNKDIKFSEYDLLDWIDADGGFNCEAFKKFLELFIASLSDNVPQEEEVVEDAKKK